MSDQYVRLAEAPTLTVSYPDCGTCRVEVDFDGDGWVCPNCGTAWASDAADGDKGELYESWSGETLTGPVVDASTAARDAFANAMAKRDRRLAEWQKPRTAVRPVETVQAPGATS